MPDVLRGDKCGVDAKRRFRESLIILLLWMEKEEVEEAQIERVLVQHAASPLPDQLAARVMLNTVAMRGPAEEAWTL